MSDADITHMRHALVLGSRGLGRVWPNPAVGCVIVKDGHIVGRGHTQDGGAPHAEARALDQAGARAKGATAYVTLEPCAHHGQTPSCADALITAGLGRVVVATTDPNPKVNGQGLARLRDAGIEVTCGVLENRARAQHIGFFTKITKSRPMITLKLAASIDGRIALASGESQWITSVAARRLVHAQRARHDAVMVGGGTARADDPTLMPRDLGITRQPVRIIWSRHLDVPLTGRLAKSTRDAPLWILHAETAPSQLVDAWIGLGARLISVPSGADQRLDPGGALAALGAAGLTRVYCEGGSALAATLLATDLVDNLVAFNAGFAIGGDGLAMVGALGLTRLAAANRFDLTETRKIGIDSVTHWTRSDLSLSAATTE